MSVVAASSSTHFTVDGIKYPRHCVVQPKGDADARIVFLAHLGGYLDILAGSTVAGSVPGNQAALIDAVAAVASAAGGGSGGGASASDIGDNLRGGAAVPVSLANGASALPGNATGTLANGTAVEVVLQGLPVPRSWFVNPLAGDTVTVSHKVSASAPSITDGAYTAAYDDVIVEPVYSITFQRTAGTGTTSTYGVA